MYSVAIPFLGVVCMQCKTIQSMSSSFRIQSWYLPVHSVPGDDLCGIGFRCPKAGHESGNQFFHEECDHSDDIPMPCPIREVNTQDHFIRKANSSGLDMDVPSCYGSLHADSLSIHVVLIGTEN